MTPQTIKAWCRQRKLEHVRVGGRILFLPEQVEKIPAALTVKAESASDSEEAEPKPDRVKKRKKKQPVAGDEPREGDSAVLDRVFDEPEPDPFGGSALSLKRRRKRSA
ncbi:hypothetical protein QDX25_07330 [Auritidibacter ignavus]|uniref:hypothetical protein n=1 Tax=Auritidibacter ignavus TaxID=678932 RepID=UPI00244D41F1|nr:hypothetical protein [Auritidibacter ignavus]WGH80620.1 hypothetical protein QDX25_07330 [Auritidibacter ignavus]